MLSLTIASLIAALTFGALALFGHAIVAVGVTKVLFLFCAAVFVVAWSCSQPRPQRERMVWCRYDHLL